MINIISRILPESIRPYTGRIVLTVLGLAIAISFLLLGFWRTVLLVALAAAGFLLGKYEDGAFSFGRR